VTIRLKTDPHKKAVFAAKVGGVCAKSHLVLVKSQCNNTLGVPAAELQDCYCGFKAAAKGFMPVRLVRSSPSAQCFSNFGRTASWMAGPGFRVNATAITLPPPSVTPLILPLKSLMNFTRGANHQR
jgi:hypothetical protein